MKFKSWKKKRKKEFSAAIKTVIFSAESGMELGLRIRGGKSINKFFFETPSKYLFRRKMLYPQYFHDIFTINRKW